MNPVMLLPFIIPIAITSFLVALLVKERRYLISNKKQVMYNENNRAEKNEINNRAQNEPYYEKLISRNKKNPDDYVDYSGGIMGI